MSSHPFVALRRGGDRPALITVDGTLTYAEVADRVDEAQARLGQAKRLVAVGGANTPEALIAYLSAIAGGHTVLLVPGDSPVNLASIVEAYDPDVTFDAASGGLIEHRAGTRHELHPDLALLMSTSGSTGSPKLVRLSHDNVVSNAEAIADYLRITPDDRALTTLPMHYCYGLSVVNSHLLSGAALVLTDWSVVDECLWRLAADVGSTSFAGVPYTFDLLDSTDFAARDLPSLRYVTQAGGRLAPERISAYVSLGRERGWDFFSMYGQTEATARMAYLPPQLAAVRPDALGVAVPGGSLRLDPVPESIGGGEGVGELVYSGPNVMMGYATCADDLRRGAELSELRTGDLARCDEGGIYTWVGRRGRIAKVFGLRIDLDEVERVVGERGLSARCVCVDDSVQVFVDWHSDPSGVRAHVATRCGLPEHAVLVSRLREQPRTASGKTDYASLERQARVLARSAAEDRCAPRAGTSAHDVRDLVAELLARPSATLDDSFSTLGGDSLSYVEVSVRLSELGFVLPPDWQCRTIREIAASRPAHPRRGVRLEMSILLRGIAILLILGSHANVWAIAGGAHLLLAVVGYNFARFHLGDRPRIDRVRGGFVALSHLVLPCVIWIGGVALVLGTYRVDTVFFLNGLEGSNHWTVQWQFWFLEAIVWTQVSALVLLAVPWIHRLERRTPFTFAMTVLAGSLVVRYLLTGVEAGATERYTPSMVLWCFALGWAVACAQTTPQRLLVSAAAVVAISGFFGDPQREAVVLAGVLLLMWVDALRVPRVLARVLGALAAASLYIYVTHWQIYPYLEDRIPVLAMLTSLAGGIAYRYVWEAGSSQVVRHLRRARRPSSITNPRLSHRPRDLVS